MERPIIPKNNTTKTFYGKKCSEVRLTFLFNENAQLPFFSNYFINKKKDFQRDFDTSIVL